MNESRQIHLAVVTGAEALGQQVVRAACGQARRIVAGVGRSKTHVEKRQRKCDEDAESREACDPRAALDEAAPAIPEARLVRRVLAVEEGRNVELVDVVAD